MNAQAHDAFCDALDAAYPRRQLFKLDELMEFFGCSRTTIERWMRNKNIITIVTPGGIRIPRSEVFRLTAY